MDSGKEKRAYLFDELPKNIKKKIAEEKYHTVQECICWDDYIEDINHYIEGKNDESESLEIEVDWETDSYSRVYLNETTGTINISDFIFDPLFEKKLDKEIIDFWDFVCGEVDVFSIPDLEYVTSHTNVTVCEWYSHPDLISMYDILVEFSSDKEFFELKELIEVKNIFSKGEGLCLYEFEDKLTQFFDSLYTEKLEQVKIVLRTYIENFLQDIEEMIEGTIDYLESEQYVIDFLEANDDSYYTIDGREYRFDKAV